MRPRSDVGAQARGHVMRAVQKNTDDVYDKIFGQMESFGSSWLVRHFNCVIYISVISYQICGGKYICANVPTNNNLSDDSDNIVYANTVD